MSCTGPTASCRAAIALTTLLLTGMCLFLSGCATPAATAASHPLLSADREDAELAKKARNDPFPTAAESGVSSTVAKSR